MKTCGNNMVRIVPNLLLKLLPKLVMLKPIADFFNKRFAYQSLLLLLFAGLIAAGIYRHGIVAAEAEKARLERRGIEAEKAAAVAAAEAGTLDSMKKPLPESGVTRFADRQHYNLARSPTFRVINSLDVNALLKLIRVRDGPRS